MKSDLAHEPRTACHICSSHDIRILKEFSSLKQVTSDCRPWKRGGRVGICRSCGFVQKIADEAFLRDCDEIYNTYAVYYQADGQEQRVFEQTRGLSMSRSESILVQLLRQHELPAKGMLLDVGCGNGNMLKSFSIHRPSWVLSGLEFDERNRDAVEGIAGVDAFYSCDLKDVPTRFDMLSLIHCLEHMIDPTRFLKQVREKLNPRGLVLIEIPDHTRNPFDLVIADHCTHFDVRGIQRLLGHCGFEPIIASTEFVPKEITVLARKDGKTGATRMTDSIDSESWLSKAMAWLRENIVSASRASGRGPLGIFGTSIAGVWLYNEISEKVRFFVDEDPARVGKRLLDRPVYHPNELPRRGIVFIPLPYEIARRISDRLRTYGDRFILPPPL